MTGRQSAAKAAVADEVTTGEQTHVAIARGFAGTIIEPGEFVPAGIPVGLWMVPAPKKAPATEV